MSDDFAENDPAWMEACRREAMVRDLLRRYPDRLTVSAVEDVAWELGLSRTTTYRLIKRYRAARTVEVLLDRPLGRPKGSLHEEPVLSAIGPVGDLQTSPLRSALQGVERDALLEMPIARSHGTA